MDFRIIAILAAAGLSGAYALALVPSHSGYAPASHPAAVLAWVKASCWHDVELQPHAARATTEDVLIVAAAMDEAARLSGRDHACRQALAMADAVISQPTRPEGSGIAQLSRLEPAR